MIRATISDVKRGEPDVLTIDGSVLEIVADMCTLAGRIYWALHGQREIAGDIFRRVLAETLADPDCPIWSEAFRDADPHEGVACQYTVRTEADDDRS